MISQEGKLMFEHLKEKNRKNKLLKEAFKQANESDPNSNITLGLKDDLSNAQKELDDFYADIPKKFNDISEEYMNTTTDKSLGEYFTEQMGGDDNTLAYMQSIGDRLKYIDQEKNRLSVQNKDKGIFSTSQYKALEDENIRQGQIEQEHQAEERFNQFAYSVESQINDFTEFGGYDLNLDQQDMQNLYDFITGTDAAGNNYFAKALSDPKILVQAAWFVLNGKQMVEDITDYFQKEISQVRQKSYNKGLEDARVKNKSNVVYKEKGKSIEEYNDLDDF